MASVCTGSLVYAAAGLLSGRPATTHWASIDHLAELDPAIDVRRDVRFVDDGDVIPRPACRPASTWPCIWSPGWPARTGPRGCGKGSSTPRPRQRSPKADGRETMATAAVREMRLEEVHIRIDYFHQATDAYLRTLGVDRAKLPAFAGLRDAYEADLSRPLHERTGYALVWELDGEVVGFSSADRISFGDEAHMHLHILEPGRRRSGLGSRFVPLSAAEYFDTFDLRRLYCEPNALNVAPNRTLQRVGFRYDRSHECTPSPINFHQVTTRWVLEREWLDSRSLGTDANAGGSLEFGPDMDHDFDDLSLDDLRDLYDGEVYFRTCGRCGTRTAPRGWSRPASRRPGATGGAGWRPPTDPGPVAWTSAVLAPRRRASDLPWPVGAGDPGRRRRLPPARAGLRPPTAHRPPHRPARVRRPRPGPVRRERGGGRRFL